MPLAAAVLTLALLVFPSPAAAAGLPARPGPGIDRQLQRAWERLEVVVEQYNDVREDLRGTRRRSAALATRLRPLRAAMRERQARIGGIASRAYRSGGGVAEVSRLLAATSPEEFADRLMIVRRLTTQQTRALDALDRSRTRYERIRAALAATAAEQRAHQRRLAERKRHILALINRLELAGGGRPWGGRARRCGSRTGSSASRTSGAARGPAGTTAPA